MNKNIEMSETSYLELIIGPMFSGKTSRIVEVYNQCKFCNIKVAVINHSIDNRYDDKLLSTHDKIKIPCIKTEKLFDIWYETELLTNNNLDKPLNAIYRFKDKLSVAMSEVVLINEGQFFPDLFDFVVNLLEYGKKVYVCGLDGDFERKKFGQMLDLIPLCDKVHKLTSLCSLCKNGNRGIFSKRISSEKEQTIVGSDNYIPVCRNCYNK